MTKKKPGAVDQKFKDGNVARVDTYNFETGDEICRRIANGRSLRDVCSDRDMPDRKTVWSWGQKHPPFRHQLARAQVDQMVSWGHDLVSIAEGAWGGRSIKVPLDSENLSRIEKDGFVTFTFDRAHVQEADLVLKTKQWLMERLASETFGLRQYLDVTQSYRDITDEELLSSFVAACRRGGVTIEMIKQAFEDVEAMQGEG